MVLEKLIGVQQQNASTLAGIQKSLNVLIKAQGTANKLEERKTRRANALARREKSDIAQRNRKKSPAQAVKKEKEEKKGFLESLMGGFGGALSGALALPIAIKAGGALIAGGLVFALTNKKVRDALFEAIKFAFDTLRKTSGKVANHAFHGFFSGFTGGGMSKEAKQARHAKGDSDDKEERKRLTELITLIDDKEQADRGYFKAASKYEKLKKEGAKAERVEKAKAYMEEQKIKSEGFHDRFDEYQDLIDKHSIDMTTSRRMRTVDEIKFGALNYGGMEYDLLREVGGYRKGGPIRVPGSGSGDKVPAILPPGSFVMNRNASGYQTGGIPVMLEPGEDVYGPGSWGPMEMMMNSIVPRFQRGGEVDAKQPKNPDAKVETTGAKVTNPDNATPGGKLQFIGDGSGISGVLNMIDGAGKLVASVGAVSGQNRTAGATQEQRMQVSGTMNPIPDGNYPLSGFAMHPGSTGLGDWSAYIGGPGGTIGSRGGMMLHTDLGHNGTAGCIGTETGPGRGTKKDRQFSNLYQKVQPSSVEVSLMSRKDGKVSGVSGGDDNSDPGSSTTVGTGNPLTSLFGTLTAETTKAMGLPGLGQYMNILGEVLMEEFGEMGKFFFGGGMMNNIMQPASAAQNDKVGQPLAMDQKGGGMAGGAQPGAMGVVGGMGFDKKQWDIYRNTLAKIESGGKYDIAGGSGDHYDGRYQMGAAAKTDAARILGIRDPGHSAGARSNFRQNAEMQEKFFAAFTKANYDYLMGNPKFAGAKPGRKLEILGYAHNQGMGGANTWLNTGKVGSDGFGTKGTAYSEALKSNLKGAGYQTGGMVNVSGSPSQHMKRFAQAQDMFESMAGNNQPIIVMAGGGGGEDSGGGTQVMSVDGAPAPPNLPDGPSVVALLELQNRLALGAVI